MYQNFLCCNNGSSDKEDCEIYIDPDSGVYRSLSTNKDDFINSLELCQNHRKIIITEIVTQLHSKFKNPRFREQNISNQDILNILNEMDENTTLIIKDSYDTDVFKECLKLFKEEELSVTSHLIKIYAEMNNINVSFEDNNREEDHVCAFNVLTYKGIEYVEVVERDQDQDALLCRMMHGAAPNMLTIIMVLMAILPQLVFTLMSVRSAFMRGDDSQTFEEVWNKMSFLLRTLYIVILGTTLSSNVFFTFGNTFAEMQNLIDKLIDFITCCSDLDEDDQQFRVHEKLIKTFCVTLLSLFSGIYNGFNAVTSTKILFGSIFDWPVTAGTFFLGSIPCMIANNKEISWKAEQIMNKIEYARYAEEDLSSQILFKYFLSAMEKNPSMIDEDTLRDILRMLKNSQNKARKNKCVADLQTIISGQINHWEKKCCGNKTTELVKLFTLLVATMPFSIIGNYNFFGHVRERIGGVLDWLGANDAVNNILSIPPALLGMGGNIALSTALLYFNFINPLMVFCNGVNSDKLKKLITVVPTVLVAFCSSFLNFELTVTNPDAKNNESVTMLLLVFTLVNSMGLTFRSAEGFVRRVLELSFNVPARFLNCCGYDVTKIDLRLSGDKKRDLVEQILESIEKNGLTLNDDNIVDSSDEKPKCDVIIN